LIKLAKRRLDVMCLFIFEIVTIKLFNLSGEVYESYLYDCG
jgi:hypothetical protein